MNYKKIRHKIFSSIIMGILCFMCLDIVSDAKEYLTYEEEMEYTYGETSYCTAVDGVYIRNEPNEDSEPTGMLYLDNRVTIITECGEWAVIESGEAAGYVPLAYLTNILDTADKDEEIGLAWVVVNASGLNVRSGPGVEYEILDVALQDTELLLLSQEGNWQMICYEDVVGYVFAGYTTEITKFTFGESFVVEEIIIDEDGIDISALQGEITGEDVVEFAMQFLGNPYVWGGTDLLNGADCSGFVQSVYSYFGISLPRTSATQRSAGMEVSYEKIEQGDIICYDGHVGIYIGDDKIINAIGSAYGIGISSATYAEIITIRRVL